MLDKNLASEGDVEEFDISPNIARLLQTYVMHKDRSSRFAEANLPFSWPESREALADAWNNANIRVAYETFLEDELVDAVTDRSSDLGCFHIRISEKHFWVPAPLMQFIPKARDLSNFYDAAVDAKLVEKGRVCLSGSTVLTGVLDSVGDFDLFEYVSRRELTHEMNSTAPQYRNGKFECIEVQVGKTFGGFPNDMITRDKRNLDASKMRTYAAKYLDNYNFAKVDMVGLFNGQLGEITNICFVHDNDWSYEPPFPSFPFQEILTGSTPPSERAYSIENFGRYAFWLRDEVQKYQSKVEDEIFEYGKLPEESVKLVLKMCKRAMSLSAMIGSKAFVDFFIETLNCREAKKYSIESAQKALDKVFEADDWTTARDWIEKKRNQLIAEKPQNLNVGELLDQIENLIITFDELCYPSAEGWGGRT